MFIFGLNCPKCSFKSIRRKNWQNFYRSALVPQNLPFHEECLVVRHALSHYFFAKCSISNIWQCSEYACLDNCSVICTRTFCYILHIKHIQNSGIFRTVYSCICRHIQTYYKGIFTHTEALLRLIQAYSPFVTHAYSQPCHILSPGIFKTGVILKTLMKLWLGIFRILP